MSTNDPCPPSGTTLERVRYFTGQLITADDLQAEQDWVRQKGRLHTRMLHGFGVVCGLSVIAPGQDDPPRRVTVGPGYAASPQGDELTVSEPTTLDLGSGATDPESCVDAWPRPHPNRTPGEDDQVVFVAIRYAEYPTRPIPLDPAGSGGDTAGSEGSRIREGFELAVLREVPQSHLAAHEQDLAWRASLEAVEKAGHQRGEAVLPVPPYATCTDDPWLVLASVRLPADATTPLTDADISYAARRPLWSVSALTAGLGI